MRLGDSENVTITIVLNIIIIVLLIQFAVY